MSRARLVGFEIMNMDSDLPEGQAVGPSQNILRLCPRYIFPPLGPSSQLCIVPQLSLALCGSYTLRSDLPCTSTTLSVIPSLLPARD